MSQSSSISTSQQTPLQCYGNVTLSGLIYVKLQQGMSVSLEESFPFVSYSSNMLVDTSEANVVLVGAAFKTAQIDTSTTGLISLDIITSIGNVGLPGYQCQYLGEARSLEIVQFPANNKIVVSLTVPANGDGTSGWYEFGFGPTQNANSSESLLMLTSNGISYQVIDNGNSLTSLQSGGGGLIDIEGYVAKSIFGIGVESVTMTMFLSMSQLNNQQYVYFAQNLQQTIQNVTSTFNLNLTSTTTQYSIYFYPMLWSNISQYNIPCTNFLSPSRAETLNLGAMGFMMGLYVVAFFFCLLFCQSQPLKSRGISPFGTLIFLIVDLGLEFQNWAPLSFVQQSLCLSQAYGLYPLQQACFVMIFLYFIRYFSIIRVNSMKNNVKVEEIEGVAVIKVAWYVRVLKLFSQLWFIFLLLLIYLLFAMIVNTLVLVGTNGQFLCEFQTLLNLRIVNGIQLILVYLLTIFLLIGDLIGHYKELFVHCAWFNYVFKMDPLEICLH